MKGGIRVHAAWIGLLVFLLAGCGLFGTAPPNSIGQLGPTGGWLEGPDQLALSVPANALPSSIDVQLKKAQPPSLPLPTTWTKRSDFYTLSADTYVPASDPFALLLPVPQGANTAQLALAVFVATGSPHAPQQDIWTFLEGTYLQAQGYFVVLLPEIPEDGLTFVLVEGPDFTSPSASPPSPGALAPAGSTGLGYQWLKGSQARVWPKGSISSATASTFQSEFDKIITLYSKSKLRSPLLPITGAKPIISLWKKKPLGYDYTNAKYSFYLVRSGDAKNGCDTKTLGYYVPKTRIMVVCVPKDGKFTALMKRTLIHEIFHAVQKRYGKSTAWWAESTAALSEVSMQDPAYQPQLTPDYSHREEWRALTAFGSGAHYRTQDWWYHVLRERSLAFDAAMHEYMLYTMDINGTNAALKNKLPDEYWHWIQDHTYLKGTHTARPATACKPDPKTALYVTQLVGTTQGEKWVDHQNDRLVFNGSVFTYKLPNDEPFPVTWRLWFTLQGDPLKPTDRTTVDTKQWGCNMTTPPTEVTVAPGQTFESGAIAANVDLGRAKDDQQPKAEGNKKFRFHAKPLRGTVEIASPPAPNTGIDVLVMDEISCNSGGTCYWAQYQLPQPTAGRYILDLPIGTYYIGISSASYTAEYTFVEVPEDGVVTLPPP